MLKKYKHKESGEVVKISNKSYDGIYMVNPVRIDDKEAPYIECDDLIDENELNQQYEQIE